MGTQVLTNGYFASFDSFVEKTREPLMAEFNRLAASQGWGRSSFKLHRERKKCLWAEYSKYVHNHLGGGSNGDYSQAGRLGKLQELCRELGVASLEIGSIKKCKNALAKVHVNVIDLLDSRRMGRKVRIFRSAGALQDYTLRTGRFFPKEIAKQDEALKALLRDVF